MKKYIWISFVILFVLGCGSRNVQKEKSFRQTKAETKTSENTEKSTQSTEAIQSQTEVKKLEISQEKQDENKSTIQNTETNSQKTKSENNSKSVKKTEYYPNGQKKSEMEMSENLSKVSDEKDYYKNRSEEYEAKLKTSVKIQDSIYNQNLDFARRNNELVKINKNTLSRLENTNKELKKASERKGISFGSIVWIVIISLIAGAIIWEILKKYLPKWRLNLFNRK